MATQTFRVAIISIGRMASTKELGELVCVTSWIEAALLHSLSHVADHLLYLAGDSAPTSVFGMLGPARSLDAIESRRIQKFPEYDEQTGRWNGDPGCLTFTAQLANGLFLIHRPAITDVGFEMYIPSH